MFMIFSRQEVFFDIVGTTGESQNRGNKKTRYVKFSEKLTYLNPWYEHVGIRIFFRKTRGAFLVTSILRFVFLPFFRRYIWILLIPVFDLFTKKNLLIKAFLFEYINSCNKQISFTFIPKEDLYSLLRSYSIKLIRFFT